MNKAKKLRKKRRAKQFYIFCGLLFLVGLLSFQMIGLCKKRERYQAMEAAQQEELERQEQRAEDLQEYEEYTKSREYIEDTAQSKLGLIYENEIIFREK